MQVLSLSQNQHRRKLLQPKPMQATTVQPLEAKRLPLRWLVTEAAMAMAAPQERREARSQTAMSQAGNHPLPMPKVNGTFPPSFVQLQLELVLRFPFLIPAVQGGIICVSTVPCACQGSPHPPFVCAFSECVCSCG